MLVPTDGLSFLCFRAKGDVMSEPVKLLSLDELANCLGITRQAAYELTRERSQCRRAVRLPVISIGKRRYVREEAFHAWLIQLEQNAAV